MLKKMQDKDNKKDNVIRCAYCGNALWYKLSGRNKKHYTQNKRNFCDDICRDDYSVTTDKVRAEVFRYENQKKIRNELKLAIEETKEVRKNTNKDGLQIIL